MIKFKISITLCFLIIKSMFIYSQVYKNVPAEYLNTFEDLNYKEIRDKEFRFGVNVTSYLPEEYSISGDVDYTMHIQQALNENSVIIMPNFPLLINYKGLVLKNGSKILFQPKSKLVIAPNNKLSYQGFWIENISDIKIYFPNIVGDKDKHLSDEGEWGMGIKIFNSKNITIKGGIIDSCWGDGVYIGGNSSNVAISNVHIDNNRRNGVSITSGESIHIHNCVISNTGGTAPQCGIDIEPNNSKDLLKNINIENILTFNNIGDGMIIVFDNLVGANQEISIYVSNHIDIYSRIGLGIYIDRGYRMNVARKMKGKIQIKNSDYMYNRLAGIKNYKSRSHNIDLIINNVTTTNSINNSKKRVRKTKNIADAVKRGVEFEIK